MIQLQLRRVHFDNEKFITLNDAKYFGVSNYEVTGNGRLYTEYKVEYRNNVKYKHEVIVTDKMLVWWAIYMRSVSRTIVETLRLKALNDINHTCFKMLHFFKTEVTLTII